MSTIVTRAGKGSALTHTELDANFTNLNTDKAGYITGEGGTVTQGGSLKTVGVGGVGAPFSGQANPKSGTITTNTAALAASGVVSFVMTNTAIAANDLLVLNHVSGGTFGAYTLNARCAAGSATIDIRNVTAGSLSEAISIRFALIKGANA